MGPNQIVGLVGSGILAIGVFTPIVSVPIVGSINYFNNGMGDGAILLGVAVAAAIVAALGKPMRALLALGLLTLGLVGYGYYQLSSGLESARAQMRTDLKDNPFAGFGEAMMIGVQPQAGWAVLAIGGLGVLAGGVMRAGSIPDAARRAPETAHAFPVVTDGPGRYRITGVDRETKFDTTWHVEAASRANAIAKAELEGIVVTEATLDHDDDPLTALASARR